MDITIWFQKFKEAAYRGPIKKIIRKIGLEMTLARMYTRLLRQTSSDRISYTVGDYSGSFYRSEFVSEELPERPVVEDLISELRANDTFFDLGANHGIYTCLAGLSFEAGQVISFEPNPKTCEALKKNIALNQLQTDVTVFQSAVADKPGKADFFIDKNSTGSSLSESRQQSDTKAIEVDVVALDSLVTAESLPIPDVIKIDVEGAELQALKGMQSILADECRLLYCEVHKSAVSDSEEVERFLSNLGFDVQTIFSRQEDQYILKAIR
jgi:FkbM family methyltransferase